MPGDPLTLGAWDPLQVGIGGKVPQLLPLLGGPDNSFSWEAITLINKELIHNFNMELE